MIESLDFNDQPTHEMARMPRRFALCSSEVVTVALSDNAMSSPMTPRLPRRFALYSSKVPRRSLSNNSLSSMVTSMPRRFAFCSPKVSTMSLSGTYISSPKRRLPRRIAMVQDHEKRSTGKFNSVPSDTSDNAWLIQSSSETIQSNESEQSKTNFVKKNVYLKPLATDIIVSCSKMLQADCMGVTNYVKTMYSDVYRKAGSELERSLILYNILNSVKERGGKFLRETFCKPGMYFEVDDWYALQRIKEAFQ